MNVLFGVPPLLTTLFALALVSAVLTVGVVVSAILAWWGRFWSVRAARPLQPGGPGRAGVHLGTALLEPARISRLRPPAT